MFYAPNRFSARPIGPQRFVFFALTCFWASSGGLVGTPAHAVEPVEATSEKRAADLFPTIVDDEPLAPPESPVDRNHTGDGPQRPTPQVAADAIVFNDATGDADQYDVKVFAAEPDVQNPIAMAWDHHGRMWVAENYTYGKRGEALRTDMSDRVIVLHDRDGDGQHDERTVFMDTLSQLTSIEVGRGGVWLMTPPRLLFVPDADHDKVPDGPAQVVLDGFDVAQQNYHNFANGLRFGPDGWLYGRCGGSCPGRVGVPGTPVEQRTALEGGIWRMNVDTKHFEVICHGTTNPWGHDWNADGELFFINTVNGHLWHGIEGAHFKRPFTLDPNPNAYELIDQHADHYHFDTKGAWTDSRDGAADAFGGGHAHCGMLIYQGDAWPESMHGRLMTLNFHGRRVNQDILKPHRSGYVGTHGPDFFTSKDPWFRGMELSEGPDGNVYVLDWSDLGECHEHTGVHRTSGRIYKVVHESTRRRRPQVAADLKSLHENQARIRLASNDAGNRWFRNRAKLIDCPQLAASRPIAAVSLLTTDSPAAQITMLRLLTDAWPIDDVYGPNHASRTAWPKIATDVAQLKPVLLDLAKRSSHASVRRMLASTLQRLPIDDRAELAFELVQRPEDVGDHNIEKLIWYGLMSLPDEKVDELAKIAAHSRLPETTRLISRSIAERGGNDPAMIENLFRRFLDASASGAPPQTAELITGLDQGLVGIARLDPPASWDELQSQVRSLDPWTGDQRAAYERVRQIFSAGQTPDQWLAIARDPSIDIEKRVAAIEGLIAVDSLNDDQSKQMIKSLQTLLRDGRVNATVATIAVKIHSPVVADLILDNYQRFRAPNREGVVALLCTRTIFADALLQRLESKELPSTVLTASHVRTILALDDAVITDRVETVWGRLRESPAENLAEIERLKTLLTADILATANLSNGRELFEKNCANCHKMYGSGGAVGPELTGAQRDDLDYWLHNIIDPGAVVGADYRATQILTEDGRLLVGLITHRTLRTITLVSADQTITLTDDDIAESKFIEQSPMPSGLLQPMTHPQIADLIAYLKHPTQVPPL